MINPIAMAGYREKNFLTSIIFKAIFKKKSEVEQMLPQPQVEQSLQKILLCTTRGNPRR